MANENPSEAPKPDAETTGLASAWNQLFSNQLAYRRERMGQLGEEGQQISALARSAAEPTEAIKEDRAAVSKEATRQAKEPVGVPDQPPTYQKPEKLRPFGQGTGPMNALQSVVNGLGLIIAMGVGTSKGFPQGALAAYSGALDGWAKGDEKRAQDQWRTYLQNVQEANDAWKRGMETREAMIRNNKDTLDALRIRLAIHEAEQGSKKEIVALMMKDHEQAMKLFELEGKEIDRLMKTNFDLFKFQVGADEKKRMNDNIIQYRDKLIQNARDRLAQAKEVHRDSMDKLATQMDQFTFNKIALPYERQVLSLGNMQKMRQAINILDQKRMLPTGPTSAENWIAWASRQSAYSDPEVAKAVTTIQSLYGPTIIGGIDRTTFNELLRAYGAFQPQLKLVEQFGPKKAMFEIFDRWESILKQGMKMNEEAALAYSGSPRPVQLMRSMRAAEELINVDPEEESLDRDLGIKR